ncbi:MAG: glycerol-3-phosphate acyltransferase, partial [Spirochaetales bacterium]|nr:glycerol-3-phosphate acyltransferase [Spirochaetales bacterium]
KRWAWLVLALDVSKAIVLCAVFGPLFGSVLGSFRLGAAVSGLFAILGHCFPVWYGFDGGKGFLAFITAAFFIDWRVGLVGAAVLLAVFFTSHYMSLASILTVVVTASATAVMYRQETWTVVCFSLGALTVILRHGENIRRLVSGTEKKLDIGNRKNR